MRNVVTCWAPECAEQIEQPATGRGRRYHSAACKQRAFRRNGGKGPSEPYPPFGPDPLHQDAPAVTVAEQPESTPEAPPQEGAAVSPEAAAPPPNTRGRPAPSDRNQARKGSGPAASEVEAEPAPATVTQLHVAVTEDSTVPVQIKVNPMVARYRADLERMGILDTRQGLHILEMAEKLVSSSTSASAATNVSRELERLMAAAEQDSPEARVGRDPSVAIRERTIAKLQALSDTSTTGTAESA
jgi:hypothetical protein